MIETRKCSNLGISLVGGNAVGIYVHSVQSGSLGYSAGLRTGWFFCFPIFFYQSYYCVLVVLCELETLLRERRLWYGARAFEINETFRS